MQLKPLNQQVVAVVGASSGIGRVTALKFAEKGAKVVVSARSQPGLDSLVEEIRRSGGEATAIAADVANFEQVEAIANHTIEQYGRLDTWVHNAAIELYASFADTTPEEFQRIIDVNLMGQVHGAKAALPHLKREGRGALVHITSVEARRSLPLQTAYAASKHAVSGFLESLRVELMHEGANISVTEVMPAAINTPLFNKARSKLGVKPMGTPPIYEPEIVADTILHVAEHPTRDAVVGDAGKAVVLAQKLSPELVDQYMVNNGFESQKTDQPKSADDPDNLYGAIPGFDTVRGDFTPQAQAVSYTNWLETHPAVKWGALAGLALGVGAIALLSVPLLSDKELF
ncbi:SDR family oxidoreductase [Nodosilinea sp. LEGE 07298]|uniref:SDR family oxidoreductase n=1 Tax=Nodosilinea sp. LEGE 07298 TaxID=2777970 RepID=UPI0018828D02|nr:SDR family oxidoreductase [Nodosilinea sp. LEGE 07298]MBE9113218.1 SDR family oxidoreductase [Nodosilinea sp. LEGE 07298]